MDSKNLTETFARSDTLQRLFAENSPHLNDEFLDKSLQASKMVVHYGCRGDDFRKDILDGFDAAEAVLKGIQSRGEKGSFAVSRDLEKEHPRMEYGALSLYVPAEGTIVRDAVDLLKKGVFQGDEKTRLEDFLYSRLTDYTEFCTGDKPHRLVMGNDLYTQGQAVGSAMENIIDAALMYASPGSSLSKTAFEMRQAGIKAENRRPGVYGHINELLMSMR